MAALQRGGVAIATPLLHRHRGPSRDEDPLQRPSWFGKTQGKRRNNAPQVGGGLVCKMRRHRPTHLRPLANPTPRHTSTPSKGSG
eukprot:2729804-Pyramimonas_sp.AAC.1